MEKGIRTPTALTIGVPCAKFELLRIHTERDITKKVCQRDDAFAVALHGIQLYLAFIYKSASSTLNAWVRG